jgi:hypothetical protein
MKQFILLFLLCSTTLSAQVDNIIVLVDVSGSVKKFSPNETSVVISEVIEGRNISNGNYTLETFSSSKITAPLTASGKKFIIVPFGNLERDSEAAFIKAIDIFNLTDVQGILNRDYPKSFSDSKTYRTLAIARTAQLAKKFEMETYWLFMISDRTGDDFLGQDAGYSTAQQELIDSYNTLTNKVDETKHGVIRYRNNSKYKVDISHLTLLNWVPPLSATSPTAPPASKGSGTTMPESCKVKLISFPNSTSKLPAKVEKTPFSVNWSCNCPEVKTFRVSINGLRGEKVDGQQRSRQITGNSATFNLEDGSYRVVVSAVGAGSSQAYVDVSTGSGVVFLIFILLLLAAAAGYYFWNKNRSNKPKPPKTKSNGSSISGSGTDISGHFR